LDPRWLSYAVNPPRAYGEALARGTLRAEPEDFVVEEDLGFAASGTGQHVLLKVRKRNANTQWVSRELAKLCGCHPRDVGFAGLKDRRAVTVQSFTVPRSKMTLEEWRGFTHPEFSVLEAEAHSRKLPRGALAGNRFVIRVRDVGSLDADGLAKRVADVGSRGIPNYFGPQRFGRDGANLARITAESLHPGERGFVLSAARSLVFNAVLAERVGDGSWERLEVGDVANLDGRGSVFPVDALDDTLIARCEELDIHPTGPQWGRGAPTSKGRVGEVEARIASEFQQACALVEKAGMDQERRALRLRVRDLTAEAEENAVVLRFWLTRGSFATTVLREFFDLDPSTEEGGD
jgi:tRNA pseudouridine13 synthase